VIPTHQHHQEIHVRHTRDDTQHSDRVGFNRATSEQHTGRKRIEGATMLQVTLHSHNKMQHHTDMTTPDELL
jgi:hypothetical protein